MPTESAEKPRRPYVVAHVAVALDGSTTGFEPDQGQFYELAATWDEDATLTGADTILAQEPVLATAPRPGPAPDGPLLAVVDGQGRVREWEALREVGHWSDVLALHAEATPPRAAGRPVQELVVGAERVDLAAALTALGRRHNVEVVRVDSGGMLLGALLSAGLLDEVSLLVHPCLPGTRNNNFWPGLTATATRFTLVDNRAVNDGLVWLRYQPHPAQ